MISGMLSHFYSPVTAAGQVCAAELRWPQLLAAHSLDHSFVTCTPAPWCGAVLSVISNHLPVTCELLLHAAIMLPAYSPQRRKRYLKPEPGSMGDLWPQAGPLTASEASHNSCVSLNVPSSHLRCAFCHSECTAWVTRLVFLYSFSHNRRESHRRVSDAGYAGGSSGVMLSCITSERHCFLADFQKEGKKFVYTFSLLFCGFRTVLYIEKWGPNTSWLASFTRILFKLYRFSKPMTVLKRILNFYFKFL